MTAFAWLRAGSRALVTLVAGAGIALAAPAARAMTIERIRLEEKSGGKSGHFTRAD